MLFALNIIAIIGSVLGVTILSDIAYRREEIPIARNGPRDKAAGGHRTTQNLVWYPSAYTHAAPGRPFEVQQAHEVMQAHRECSLDECPHKDAAYRALVEAGRIRPRS